MKAMEERYAKELKKRDAYVDDFTRVMSKTGRGDRTCER